MELEQSVVQIEHPDRVAWYQSLIQQWTGQMVHVMVAENGSVAAWVTPYTSQGGFWYSAPTQVWAVTIEQAFEQLANYVYEDMHMDLACLANAEQWSADRQAAVVLSMRP